jgi:hypothetical protein
MKPSKRTVIGGVVIAALLATGGGVAYAATSGSAAPSAPPASAHPQQRPARSLWSRVEHGEATMRVKQQDKLVDVQRGQVTAVSPNSVTVRSVDGYTATYTVNPQTKVRKNKAAAAIDAVQTGDRIGVLATKAGSNDTATRIVDAGPPKTTN